MLFLLFLPCCCGRYRCRWFVVAVDTASVLSVSVQNSGVKSRATAQDEPNKRRAKKNRANDKTYRNEWWCEILREMHCTTYNKIHRNNNHHDNVIRRRTKWYFAPANLKTVRKCRAMIVAHEALTTLAACYASAISAGDGFISRKTKNEHRQTISDAQMQYFLAECQRPLFEKEISHIQMQRLAVALVAGHSRALVNRLHNARRNWF